MQGWNLWSRVANLKHDTSLSTALICVTILIQNLGVCVLGLSAFHAADVNDRINTRARLKRHDPMLATILEGTFGDGEWMYQNTSPAPLSFNYASR